MVVQSASELLFHGALELRLLVERLEVVSVVEASTHLPLLGCAQLSLVVVLLEIVACAHVAGTHGHVRDL